MKADQFSERHLGPRRPEIDLMLDTIGVASVDELVARTIPASILMDNTMNLPGAVDEQNYLAYMKEVASKNKMFLTYMGIGYYNTILPPVKMSRCISGSPMPVTTRLRMLSP